MNDWVTIATFTYPHEVTVLEGVLETEGIECFIKDRNIVSTNPLYSHAIGGVKIQVHENDVERANEIVKEYYAKANNEEGDDSKLQEEEKIYEVDNESSVNEVKCPHCGSTDVNVDKRPSRFSIILTFLLVIPLFFRGKKKYHCFNCGADFAP